MNLSSSSSSPSFNGSPPSGAKSATASVRPESRGFSPERFGAATYRMAWLAEAALFGLAMMLAVFNVLSVWDNGNRLQGLILAAGWVAIAIVELSVIPLAGAIRISSWKDKWLAIIGVMGIAALSAWTVYEFNEFASYYLTQPARDAVIEVAAKRSDAVHRRKSADELAQAEQAAANEISRLSEEQTARLASMNAAYKEQTDSRRAESDSRVASIEASLPKPAQPDQSATESIQLLLEKRQSLVNGRDAELRDLQQKAAADKAARDADATSRRSALTEQRTALQVEIDKLRATMLAEMAAAGGVFKEARKKALSESYSKEIAERSARMAQIDRDLVPSIAVPVPAASPEVAAIRSKADEETTAIDRQIADFREVLRKQALADAASRAADVARVRAQVSTVQEEFRRTVEEDRKAFDASVAKTKRDFDERIRPLTAMTATDGSARPHPASLRSEADQLEKEANTLEATTDSRMERILYFRIAKWFHDGPGLPTKDAYLRGQIRLFAPAGAFLSLVAIALAYIGVGLQYDKTQENAGDGRAEKKEQAQRAAETKDDAALEAAIEKRFRRAIEFKDRALAAADATIRTLQDGLAKLGVKVAGLEAEIVDKKINYARAVHSIPQIISVSGGDRR